jgi:hypothetical protein
LPPISTQRSAQPSSFAAVDAVVQVDHVQHVEQLPLVFVDALDLHVEQRVGVELDPALGLDQFGEARLVGALDRAPFGVECLMAPRSQRFELFQLRQVGDPAFADLPVISALMPGLACATQRRGVTPLVLLLNLLRPQLDEVAEQAFLQQPRVQRGDAVDREAADDGEIGHAHLRTSPSSMSDMRRRRSMSPGHFIDTSRRKRALIS